MFILYSTSAIQNSFLYNIYQGLLSGQSPIEFFSSRRCTLEVPESGGDTWDYDRHCWSKKISGLCTYKWYILVYIGSAVCML